MEIDRKKWGLILALIFVAGLAAGIVLHTRPGVNLGGEFHFRLGEGRYGSLHGTELTTKWEGERFFATLTHQDKSMTVSIAPSSEEDLLDVTFHEGETLSLRAYGDWLTLQDGMPLHYAALSDEAYVIIHTDAMMGGADAYSISDYSLAQTAYGLYLGHSERFGHPIFLLFYALAYALGAASILFPEETALWGNRWRYERVELSYDGITAYRVMGVVVCLMALFFAVGMPFVE